MKAIGLAVVQRDSWRNIAETLPEIPSPIALATASIYYVGGVVSELPRTRCFWGGYETWFTEQLCFRKGRRSK
jgi:hypothetical protein